MKELLRLQINVRKDVGCFVCWEEEHGKQWVRLRSHFELAEMHIVDEVCIDGMTASQILQWIEDRADY